MQIQIAQDKSNTCKIFPEYTQLYNCESHKLPKQILDSMRKTVHEQNKIQVASDKKQQQIIQCKQLYLKCSICQSNKHKQQFLSLCQHNHYFCCLCLNQYAYYKISKFQQIYCPHNQCSQLINVSSTLFQSFPNAIQQKYYKINNFYSKSQNSLSKICYNQQCQESILINHNNSFKCNKCQQQYCGKCSLFIHSGECEEYQLNYFYRNNLYYRQCSRCRYVIERIQGCNHMICRCGYQFCYDCGNRWQDQHICVKKVNGQSNNLLRDQFGHCPFLLKIVMKIIFFIGLTIFLLIKLLVLDIGIQVCNILVSILFGISYGVVYAYTEYCYSWMVVAMIILPPIAVMIGMHYSFNLLFIPQVHCICDAKNYAVCQYSLVIFF